MEKNLYKFIIRFSLRQQIIITLLSVASFGPYYYYLSMPKTIINEGIGGKHVTYPVDLWGLGVLHLDKVDYLLVLCFGFLLLVLVQQAFKYAINVFQGIAGERMLRRLRYDLYAQVLRFPLPTFRKTSQGEIIPMVIAEVEPVGGFIGESFALPIFQGGMLLVIFGFLVIQNPVMAMAAVALYPIQFYIVPKLQRRVRALGKERIKNQRRLSDRIGETVTGVVELHTHDGSNRMLADFAKRLGISYWIRVEIFQRKFVIKFVNNFIQQLGPFFFYSIGGYLVIKGQMDVGTVIAAVNAHKEMAAPWKELLNHYQTREDVKQKYEQVVSNFEPEGMPPPEDQLLEPAEPVPLNGPINVSSLTLNDDQGNAVLDNLSLTIPWPARVAVVGGSGREDFLQVLARLQMPTRGKVSINGRLLSELPETVTGRRLAYVGSAAHIFNATLGDNLFLGLRYRPVHERQMNERQRKHFERELVELKASGNILYDVDADWTDYKAAGVDKPEDLGRAAIAALRIAAFDEDVFQFGMRGTINPKQRGELADRVLQARRAFRSRLADGDIADLVEGWDPERYNTNATVAENLLFGTARELIFDVDNLASDPFTLGVLEQVGLRDRFLRIGYEVASTMVELFADLPPDHEFFQQFSFISSDDLPDYKELLARAKPDNLGQLADADRARLMTLPFKLILTRHRLGQIDENDRAAILQARKIFSQTLPEDRRGSIAFFDPEHFNASASIVDNILFGRVAYGQAQAQEKIGAVMADVIKQLQLRDPIIEVGFNFDVGISGARLNSGQRQKLAIARALLKQPDWVMLSESTASLDPRSHAAVLQALLEQRKQAGLVWSLQRVSEAEGFDIVVVIADGRVVGNGRYADLAASNEAFKKMLQG
ncbi:ABC transporter ATP-binding protein [Ferrovibrio sp.]|uniref:ABC transporter ATP-binding protein n=1 Tax=Ferrovibrio sp. TaxID=1917215 RepID=UPI0025BE3E59|nr:ABC transporter ATP-binding protein [Ferrovibrio sp.]MBX3454157.1 ABC transporter ATP-binding protein [Ferrovibrio sp.]